MRLCAIKIAGFKSFVEPTTLTLDGDLTGIVGPNGCGKSNVIDAVRWVTGESSAKQLRGEALEDVIFKGTNTRQPVGKASVELRFDNSNGAAGGQYANFGDIAIRRELTRDGGSSFFINGARARRRDVVDLFLGTGLGGRSNYAVIEQGAVTRLVEARAEDMRQVLEEAAGISRYKEHRRETENRIRHTRDNLERLNDRIGEVQERLGVLQRQAKNAEKYKQLKQDERRLRAELLALRWRALDADVHAARQTLNGCERTLADSVSAQQRTHAERDACRDAQQTAADACQQHQAAFYAAQGEATRLAQALEHARQMRDMQAREREQLDTRQQQLSQRLRDEQDALAQAEETITRVEAQRGERRDTLEAARQQLHAEEMAVEQAEQQRDAFTGEQTPLARLEAERTQRAYVVERLEQAQAACDKCAAEAEELAAAADDEATQALAQHIEALSERLATDEAQRHELAQALESLGDDRAALTHRVDDARTEQARLQARLASVKTLQQGVLREDDDGVRAWLERQGEADVRSVARRIEAPAHWQIAVEAALPEWLSAFAVGALPTQSADWPGMRLTLVEDTPPATPDSDTQAAGLPSLASGMRAPAAVLAAAADVFVADDMATAQAARTALAPHQRIVTIDGACVGAAFLSTPDNTDTEASVLARERDINALTTQVEATTQCLQQQQARLQEVTTRQHEQQQQHDRLEQAVTTAKQELAGQRATYQGQVERDAHRRRRVDELAREQARLQQQCEHTQAELQALDARIETLADEAEAHVRQRDAAQATLAEARQRRDAARRTFDAADEHWRHGEQQDATARGQRDQLAERVAQTRQAHAQARQQLQAFDAEASSADVSQQPNAREVSAAQQQQRAAEDALRQARATLEQAQQGSESAAHAALQADAAVAQARERMQQARIDMETASARRDGLDEQLQQHEADVATVLQRLDTQAGVEAWQDKIAAVERKLARLGAINLAAIEEYEQEREREQYLNEQHQDLGGALETLENAIARIDRETRSRFKQTFTQVNERFGAIFPTLFGGGQAALELTEQDLLATGVRVMARPPGKRNASIQMLSGGEKTLAALALLFALFELNPAPFCMLDEIDAPLDDSNVSRFCDLLRQMTDNTQFIVITHNKLTMELAQQLHGVTMAEPGVSRLVSVDIGQALDMAQ